MASPYSKGDVAAHFVIDGDVVRVRRAEVESCVRLADDRYSVVTTEGIHQVNGQGEGSELVPLDDELRAEFDRHPDGWTVVETLRDVDRFPEQSMEQGRDGHGLSH